MASVEVTVRGAGIFGLATAWACARAGARVRVVDPGGVAAGASGGLVGALAPHAPEGWNPLKAFQLDALLMAEGWWDTVARAGGVAPGYLRSGRLQPLADAAAVALAREREGSAQTLWQGRAAWRVVPAPARGPDSGPAWTPESPSGWVVHDTLTARISPRAACRALAAALAERGAEIVAEAPDRGAVVHATGHAGLAALSQAAGRRVGGGQKGQAVLFRHDAAGLPQIYAGGLHVVPHADGTVAVGSTSENEWVDQGPDGQADALAARARALVPALARAELIERWAGIRPRARTRAPVAGAWPGKPGHFIANGGFKIGFAMAPPLGDGLADLILAGREDAIPAAFRPDTLLG